MQNIHFTLMGFKEGATQMNKFELLEDNFNGIFKMHLKRRLKTRSPMQRQLLQSRQNIIVIPCHVLSIGSIPNALNASPAESALSSHIRNEQQASSRFSTECNYFCPLLNLMGHCNSQAISSFSTLCGYSGYYLVLILLYTSTLSSSVIS